MILGREFLDVAGYLESMDGEASTRSRIGRSYYAAFLETRAYCESHHGYHRTKSGRDHADIVRLMGQVDPELAVDLSFLRKHRNISDYEIDVSAETVQRQSVVAKQLALSIISRLDDLTLAASQAAGADEDGESGGQDDQ